MGEVGLAYKRNFNDLHLVRQLRTDYMNTNSFQGRCRTFCAQFGASDCGLASLFPLPSTCHNAENTGQRSRTRIWRRIPNRRLMRLKRTSAE